MRVATVTSLVPTRAPGWLCPRCRMVLAPGEVCGRCDASTAESFPAAAVVAVEHSGGIMPGWRASILLSGLCFGALFAAGVWGLLHPTDDARQMVSLLLTGVFSPSLNMVASGLSGREQGYNPLRLLWPRRGLLRPRRQRARGPLLLAAPGSAPPGSAGRVRGDGQVVARLDTWFLPWFEQPFAWQATSEGFEIALADGVVEVPAGRIRLEVPAGRARTIRRTWIGRAGPLGFLVQVELRGGDRVHVQADLAAAEQAGGYRDSARRLVARGLPTIVLE